MDAVNSLFEARHFPLPAALSTAGNTAILVENLYKEEKTTNQCCPLNNNKIFTQLHSAAKKSCTSDLIDQVLFNIVALGRYIRPRINEFAQKKQSSVDYHTYPLGTKVVKAFTTEDFIFFDRDGNHFNTSADNVLTIAQTVQITWWIQKNSQNGQSITLATEPSNPEICPVRNALTLVLLEQLPNMPVCIYPNKNGTILYLTGQSLARLFWKAVKAICHDIPAEDLSKYLAHSLRVWACILLDEAGKSPDFIKKHLCWMGDSFQMYL